MRARLGRMFGFQSWNTLRVRVFTRGDITGFSVLAEALNDSMVIGSAVGGFTDFIVPVPSAHLWSPDDPFLYRLRITLRNASGAAVEALRGLRSFTVTGWILVTDAREGAAGKPAVAGAGRDEE